LFSSKVERIIGFCCRSEKARKEGAAPYVYAIFARARALPNWYKMVLILLLPFWVQFELIVIVVWGLMHLTREKKGTVKHEPRYDRE